MVLAALSNPPAPGALPILDTESLLQRLPATLRAQLAWTSGPIERGLRRLRDEPLTDELLGGVAMALVKPVLSLGKAFWEVVASNRDAWHAAVMEDLRKERTRLAAFLEEGEARDTLEWVLGFFQSVLNLGFTLLQLGQPAEVVLMEDAMTQELTDQPDALALLRGQVALMGALEAVKAGASAERVRDLLDMAFLDFTTARRELRRQGLWISPWPDETAEERRERLLASIEELRRTTTAKDWDVLQDARMRDLR